MDVAIVMPAHNEVGGIAEFLREIDDAVAGTGSIAYVVVDDASTDDTAAQARAAARDRGLDLLVSINAVNRGHGPSALRAYRDGLATGAPVVLHVDGDGQFTGSDVRAMLTALDGCDVVHGVRRGRTDAWYRRVLTGLLGLAARTAAGRSIADVNTPLRAYRAEVLATLLREVPKDSLVPHVHLSVLEARHGVRVGALDVASLPRRGGPATGTMWGRARHTRVLPPTALVSFVARAAREVTRSVVLGRRRSATRVGIARAERP